ncbi:hypothetical protein [Stenotrophomonas muris]|uniref:hypothetical protein n=1 Tax=Stenotrophomonas muris TaxID=2963283 RepID=UPI0037348E2C
MTRIELTHFLKKIGVAINQERIDDYRWASRPLGAQKPILRFRTLNDAENFWMKYCRYILYKAIQIDESISKAADSNPDVIDSIARWLDPSTPDAYPPDLSEAAARLPEYHRPQRWKLEIMKLASELGPLHDEWAVQRACHYRSLSRFGYHDASTKNRERLGDNSDNP